MHVYTRVAEISKKQGQLILNVPLCLQFILLICWTFCGLYVFCCGAFALDRLLIIVIIFNDVQLLIKPCHF